MSKRIVGTASKDKIVGILEEVACNRDDYDLRKCAAEIRELVKKEGAMNELCPDCGCDLTTWAFDRLGEHKHFNRER